MQVEIINIGNELLIGQVVNTNASYMAKMLNNNGFEIVHISTIADKKTDIHDAVLEAMRRVDIIIITGGLGPTKDDITKTCLAEIFGGEMKENTLISQHIKRFFAQRGLPYTNTNRFQAFVPTSCEVIFNNVGTAPGMVFYKEKKTIISLPGVPFEMKEMMPKVIDLLCKKYDIQTIIDKNLVVAGISESFLSDMLEEFEKELQQYNISLAYLPDGSIIKLRLSLHEGKKEEGETLMQREFEKLKRILGKFLVSQKEELIEETIGKLLKNNKQTLSTAESCTGGNIAHRITLISGASEYFRGSIVAYNNEIKQNVLNVSPSTLEKYHAVSEQTVIEMAKSSVKIMNSDYSIATSGLAGPNSDGTEIPVGTIWICVANKKGEYTTHTTCYTTTRENFIDRVSNEALFLLLNFIRSGK